MSISYLEYQLQNGYIHTWLVAGPQAIFVPDLDRFEGEDFKLQIARHYHEPHRHRVRAHPAGQFHDGVGERGSR